MGVKVEAGCAKALHELARHEFVAKMLCEIAQDMTVCKLEGWNEFEFPELLKKEIENYEKAKADNFVGWARHHRLETHNSDGERRLVQLSVAELKALDMYYNRPPEELIWLRHDEHKKLHCKGKK